MSVRRLGVETRTMRTRRRDGGFWEPCGLRLCRWLEFWYFCGPWFVFEIVVIFWRGLMEKELKRGMSAKARRAAYLLE